MMELRNGVHKYELNLQAGGSITAKMPESTDISCYFRYMRIRHAGKPVPDPGFPKTSAFLARAAKPAM